MPCFSLLRRHREPSTTPSRRPAHSPSANPAGCHVGCIEGERGRSPKVTPATPCGPSGPCRGASRPWIWGFGDLGSGARPGAGRCRSVSLFSRPGALVLGDAASLLFPRGTKGAPPAHALSCSPGEGTARGTPGEGQQRGDPSPALGFSSAALPDARTAGRTAPSSPHGVLGGAGPSPQACSPPAQPSPHEHRRHKRYLAVQQPR